MVEEAISFWTDIQRYEDMLAADPRSYCFAPLSELYRKLGLLDDAIHVAQKGSQLHPDYPGAFFALGLAYYEKGLKSEARTALEKVIELSPDNLRAQKVLSQLYVEAGETALARKALQEVLQQNPDDLESALQLRSLMPSAATTAPDEESLEEAEIIEELTEVFEEGEEPEAEAFEAEPEAEAFEAEAEAEEFEPEAEAEEPAAQSAGYEPFEDEEFEEGEALEEDRSQEAAAPWNSGAPGQPAALHPSRDPLTTATLAELYVSQGFLDKAIKIYQELLSADPEQSPYRSRCNELVELRSSQKEPELCASPAPVPEPLAQQAEAQAPQGDAEAELSRWLENIRRRRDGL